MDQQKSVLLIAPQPFFRNRGTPFNVRAMVAVLGERGYEVDLLVYPQGEDIEIPGVRIHRSFAVPGIKQVAVGPSLAKIVLDVGLFFKTALMLRRKSYSIIHGVEEGAFIAGTFALLRRTPYIVDMDSCMLTQLQESGLLNWRPLLSCLSSIEQWFVQRSAAVLTVCEALSVKAGKISSGVPIHQIEDFPVEHSNIVDAQLLVQLKQELETDGVTTLVYTGNFASYQGLDLLFEAFAEVAKERKLKLVLAGGTSEQIEQYRELAQQLGVGEQVCFLGQRPPEEMGTLMALADVLVSPRIEGENTPLKLYSYMASGRAVLATKILSHTQVLNDASAFLGGTGVSSFAAALERSVDNSEAGIARREAVASRAKHLVETRYSFAEFRRRLLALYEQVIGAPYDFTEKEMAEVDEAQVEVAKKRAASAE